MSVNWGAWIELAKNGGLVLGLAISIYTVYSFVEVRVLRRRQRYALLKNVYEEFSYFLSLASSLANRANQAEKLYVQHLTGSYPPPAADQDALPEDAERVSRWLVKRANHLTSYPLPMEIDKLGAVLNRRQADALFALIAARRVYVQVLAARGMDLDTFPRKPGVFARFVGVADLNVSDLNDKLKTFAKTLGLSTPELNSNQSRQRPPNRALQGTRDEGARP
jgi:hypothetical protein